MNKMISLLLFISLFISKTNQQCLPGGATCEDKDEILLLGCQALTPDQVPCSECGCTCETKTGGNECVGDDDARCVDATCTPTTNPTTTAAPTTAAPTTTAPTTTAPTTAAPTTAAPTTAAPTTTAPTTASPTTAMPTTSMPTTSMPTTSMPTTSIPTTAIPTESPSNDPTEEPTTIPTEVPTMEPNFNPCPECPFNITLISIGNITISPCPIEEPVTPSPTILSVSQESEESESSNQQEKNRNRWKYRSGSSDSSGSSRRRRHLLSNSDSSVITDSWYTNKKCVPNCYQWGQQRSIECQCYESCTTGALNESCYEGNRFGYCGTGVCCCGGECMSTQCDSNYGVSSSDRRRRRSLLGSDRCSVSSDSGDGYYSYAEWFKDRCGLTQDDGYYSSDSNSNSDDGTSSDSGRRRRRHLLGASFGSIRHLHSDSSSSGYGNRYETLSNNDEYNDFLIETCVTYEITGEFDENCIQSDIFIFLPLCENNLTDFNSSNLNTSDITNIITESTFEAQGCEFENELGVCVELSKWNNNTNTFEICFGNVTVNAENVDTFNITTIDTSNGIAIFNTSDGQQACPIDGLPCFNFFFDADCPPTTTIDNTYRSCECDDGEMIQLNLLYNGDGDDVSITFRRGYRRGSLRGATYNNGNAFSVSNGDIIEVTSESGGYNRFGRYTGVQITDSNGDIICIGYIRRCSIDIIGESVPGCDDLIVNSWIDSDGALCDEIAVDLDLGSSSGENALIDDRKNINNVFKIFNDLDPYIKYSLISIFVMFCILMCIGAYICIKNDNNEKNNHIENEKEKTINKMHSMALKQNENNNINNTNENEYSNNEKDNIYEDEYYNDMDDDDITVEMVNRNNRNDKYLD